MDKTKLKNYLMYLFRLGLNWITLILGRIGLVSRLEVKLPLKVIFVGIIMCIFDFVLEITAPKLNYWFWVGGMIPLNNFFLGFKLL